MTSGIVPAVDDLRIRPATRADVAAIVALLADDELGAQREVVADPPPRAYLEAWERIERSPGTTVVVAETTSGEVVATLQLDLLPSLSHQGALRAQIEGVRVAAGRRSSGIGRRLVEWAISQARREGCRIVQLTSHRSRDDALRFYRRLGFEPTHRGLKLTL
jgi:GNAT superfamily N-acetyltransferase